MGDGRFTTSVGNRVPMVVVTEDDHVARQLIADEAGCAGVHVAIVGTRATRSAVSRAPMSARNVVFASADQLLLDNELHD